MASAANWLGTAFYQQGRYEEARPLFEASLRVRERLLPEGHADVATALMNLAGLLDRRATPCKSLFPGYELTDVSSNHSFEK